MNTETTVNAEAPHTMRISRAAAARRGLLPPREQAAHDHQKAAEDHNAPILDQIELAKKREKLCAQLLPQLVISLRAQGADADRIDDSVEAAKAEINDILDDLHHERVATVATLGKQLK